MLIVISYSLFLIAVSILASASFVGSSKIELI